MLYQRELIRNFEAVPFEVRGAILADLKRQPTSIHLKTLAKQMDRLFSKDSPKARDWQNWCIQNVSEIVGTQNLHLNQHIHSLEYLNGAHIFAKYRLALMEYRLARKDQITISAQSMSFFYVCMDKPYFLASVLPIVLALSAHETQLLTALFEVADSLSHHRNYTVRKALATGVGHGLRMLDLAHTIKGLELLRKIGQDDDRRVVDAAHHALSFAIGTLDGVRLGMCLETLKVFCHDKDEAIWGAVIRGIERGIQRLKDKGSLLEIENTLELWAKDKNDRIRKAAVKGSTQIILKCNPIDNIKSLKTLCNLSWDPSGCVREKVAIGLCQISARFGLQSMTLLEKLSKDSHVEVKKAVVKGLCEALNQQEPLKRVKALALINVMALDQTLEVQRTLATGLGGAIGALDKQGLESLVSLSKNDNARYRQAVAEGIEDSIDRVVPLDLIKSLDVLKPLSFDKDFSVRKKSTRVIKSLIRALLDSDKGQKGVNLLENWSQDQQWEVRAIAAKSLIHIILNKKDTYEKALQILKSLSSDIITHVRKRVVNGFCYAFDHDDKEGLTGLISFSTDIDSPIREVVAEKLSDRIKDMDPESQALGLSCLNQLSKDCDEEVRQKAAKGLIAGLGSLNDNQLEALKRLTMDEFSKVRQTCALYLSQEPKAFNLQYIDWLHAFCQDTRIKVRRSAAVGLNQSVWTLEAQKFEQGIVFIKNLVKDKHWKVREAVAKGVAHAVEGLKDNQLLEATNILKILVQDEDCYVRRAAYPFFSLQIKTADMSGQLVNWVSNHIKSDDEYLRQAIAMGLGQAIQKQYSKHALSLLITMCQDKNVKVRLSAARGISEAIDKLDPTDLKSLLEEMKPFKLEVKEVIYNRISCLWPEVGFRQKIIDSSKPTLVFQGPVTPESSKKIQTLVNNFKQMKINCV